MAIKTISVKQYNSRIRGIQKKQRSNNMVEGATSFYDLGTISNYMKECVMCYNLDDGSVDIDEQKYKELRALLLKENGKI